MAINSNKMTPQQTIFAIRDTLVEGKEQEAIDLLEKYVNETNKELEDNYLLSLIVKNPELLNNILRMGDYWKDRCLAAEQCIVSKKRHLRNKWDHLVKSFPDQTIKQQP